MLPGAGGLPGGAEGADDVIVLFHSYVRSKTARMIVSAALGGVSDRWSIVRRRNAAARLPSDFALLRLGSTDSPYSEQARSRERVLAALQRHSAVRMTAPQRRYDAPDTSGRRLLQQPQAKHSRRSGRRLDPGGWSRADREPGTRSGTGPVDMPQCPVRQALGGSALGVSGANLSAAWVRRRPLFAPRARHDGAALAAGAVPAKPSQVKAAAAPRARTLARAAQ